MGPCPDRREVRRLLGSLHSQQIGDVPHEHRRPREDFPEIDPSDFSLRQWGHGKKLCIKKMLFSRSDKSSSVFFQSCTATSGVEGQLIPRDDATEKKDRNLLCRRFGSFELRYITRSDGE